jgi:DNA repair protein RadC
VHRITNPREGHSFFESRIADNEVEEFWAAALNADKVVTAAQCLFRGTVDGCLVHPRDVFRFACRHNAVSIIVAHNHPSGSVAPSVEDCRLTQQLLCASRLLRIPMDDHLIISGRKHFSFLQNGQLKTPIAPLWPVDLGLDRC